MQNDSADTYSGKEARTQCRKASAAIGPMLAGLLVAYMATAWVVGVGLVDDAYIFLRYARNVSDGLGPVFNAGEWVEGYSSPLWLAITTLLFAFRSEPSQLLLLLGGGVGLASVCVLALSRGLLPGVVLAVNVPFVFWSFSGMETPLAALLLLVAYVVLVDTKEVGRKSCIAAGTAFVLAALCRLDVGWVLAVLVATVWLRSSLPVRRRAKLIGYLVAPLVVLLAHFLWRYSFYGEWLPNTFHAKVGLDPAVLASNGFQYLGQSLWLLLPLVALGVVASGGKVLLRGGVIAGLWSLLMLLVGGDHFPLLRFLVPILPLLLSDLFHTTGSSRGLARPVAVAVLLTVTVVSPVVGEGWVSIRREVALPILWGEVGKWIEQSTPDDSTVAFLAVGSLPYYSKRTVIDMLGLTDQHIAHRGRVYERGRPGHQRYDSSYILARRPDLIVLPMSGRSTTVETQGWPQIEDVDFPYFYSYADLLRRPETQTLYEFRRTLLPNGTYLEGLWLKDQGAPRRGVD